MDDEFDRIMEFFNLSPEEKEKRLQNVFQDCVEYFERFKYIMINGSNEEKKEAVKKVMILKKKIQEETQRVCEKTGLTPEQLASFSNNSQNFSSEQWETISQAKKHLEDGVGEIKKAVRSRKDGRKREGALGDEKKDDDSKKPKKPPKNWIPS